MDSCSRCHQSVKRRALTPDQPNLCDMGNGQLWCASCYIEYRVWEVRKYKGVELDPKEVEKAFLGWMNIDDIIERRSR